MYTTEELRKQGGGGSAGGVGGGGGVSVCTSESPGQSLLGEIRGVQHLGHWIRRSDVGQIAPQIEPNPRYRRIGPKSDLPNVRDNHGRLYLSLRQKVQT